MNIKELVEVSNGEFFGNEELLSLEPTGYCIDSSSVKKGFAFGAIKGKRVDGHTFIKDAYKNGAIICFGNKVPEEIPDDACFIKVEDSVKAIGKFANLYMKKLSIPIISITGSVGKTSTKDTIATVLGKKFKVGKTQGNKNNELGLPLTCLSFEKDVEIAVLEMGISEKNEMDYLLEIVSPDVAVVTNIGVTHIENLGSRENIFLEKSKIYKKNKIKTYLCGDDDILKEEKDENVIFFGEDEKNDIFATKIKENGYTNSFTLKVNESFYKKEKINRVEDFEICLNALGRHMVSNSLVAAAIGFSFGIEKEKIVEALSNIEISKGRLRIVKTDKYTLIDDAYNASPVSVMSAINTLSRAKERKVAVLGDMLELGKDSKKLHYDTIANEDTAKKIDVLVAIGNFANDYIQAFKDKTNNLENKSCYTFNNYEEFINKMNEILRKDDVILVKASNSMKFEKIVKAIESA